MSAPRISYTVWAPSVMWNWVVNPKLSVTAALREDKLDLERTGTFPVGQPNVNNGLWDRSISELSVNLGAVYKATDKDTCGRPTRAASRPRPCWSWAVC
jgi:outer membrane receptor for ferrienterochelin and colicins